MLHLYSLAASKGKGCLFHNFPVDILQLMVFVLVGSASVMDLGSTAVPLPVYAWPTNLECVLHFKVVGKKRKEEQ